MPPRRLSLLRDLSFLSLSLLMSGSLPKQHSEAHQDFLATRLIIGIRSDRADCPGVT